jgi:hypothetical protein
VDLQERVTDRQRERAAADVQAAVGDGLLTLDEADVRLAQVWAARTSGELVRVHEELPAGWLKERRRHEASVEARTLARKALPAHVRSWLMLMSLLVGIWFLTTPGDYFWPVWPALGTGMCLAGHIAAARRAPR